MEYEQIVSGVARPGRRAPATPMPDRAPHAHAGRSSIRTFPPVLQFLTKVPVLVEQQLQAISQQAYRDDQDVEQICHQVYQYALSLGFEATIGVQEVYSQNMPSFPGQTVMTSLLLIDMRALPSGQPGYEMGQAV